LYLFRSRGRRARGGGGPRSGRSTMHSTATNAAARKSAPAMKRHGTGARMMTFRNEADVQALKAQAGK
jgi:hypothetical protein